MSVGVLGGTLREATSRGIDYLLGTQAADGHWLDYRLPVGASDAWVTAYVGLALSFVAEWSGDRCAGEAAGCAAAWLAAHRPYPAGWGYNGITGPDADSTALALTLQRRAAIDPLPADEAWLRARRQPGGGFATYEGPGAWGTAHVDVTPATYGALNQIDQAELCDEVVEFLLRTRLPDGTWPSYWWRGNLYSTLAALELLLALGEGERLATPSRAAGLTIASSFELALAIEIASLGGTPGLHVADWVQALLDQQSADGSWPGGDNLRVTDPACFAPWLEPVGRRYRDQYGLLTTVTVVRALARYAR